MRVIYARFIEIHQLRFMGYYNHLILLMNTEEESMEPIYVSGKEQIVMYHKLHSILGIGLPH